MLQMVEQKVVVRTTVASASDSGPAQPVLPAMHRPPPLFDCMHAGAAECRAAVLHH